MKRVFFFLLTLFGFQSVYGQPAGGQVMPGGIVAANVAAPPTFLREVFSTAVEPKGPAGVEGSPFIFDNWLLARLSLADGRLLTCSLQHVAAVHRQG